MAGVESVAWSMPSEVRFGSQAVLHVEDQVVEAGVAAQLGGHRRAEIDEHAQDGLAAQDALAEGLRVVRQRFALGWGRQRSRVVDGSR